MDPPSTQVFGGPWGGRDLPSVGGRFPSLQRHGVIRKGRLHKPPDSPQPLPLSCVLYIRDLLYCTMVQCRDSRVVAVAVQNDRHQRGSVADGKTTTLRSLSLTDGYWRELRWYGIEPRSPTRPDLTCSFPVWFRARVCVYMLCAIALGIC